MRVVIMGGANIGLEAAIIAARGQIVCGNELLVDNGGGKTFAMYQRDLSIKRDLDMFNYRNCDEYAEQTAPNGRSGKAHNLILAMNKKGKRF